VRDTQPPQVSIKLSSPFYNKANDETNPFIATATALDATSGVDPNSYTWSGTGLHFNTSSPYSKQSPAITIDAGQPDGSYNVSVRVADLAGNHSDPVATLLTKDTVAPGPPTRPQQGYDQTSQSPWFYYPYKMMWYWNASSPADTFLVLLNGKAQGSGLLSTASYGPVTAVDYGTYELTVREVDEAGNQSDGLSIPIIVTPVVPPNNSTDISQYTGLQWRDFTGRTGTHYRVHLWSISEPSKDLGSLPDPLLADMRQSGPYTNPDLIPGQTYDWYIEWSFDGGTTYNPENRSPSDGTYYSFTVGQ
jgi:hypothetical protein